MGGNFKKKLTLNLSLCFLHASHKLLRHYSPVSFATKEHDNDGDDVRFI